MSPLHLWSTGPLLVCVPADAPDAVLAPLRAAVAGDPTVDAVLEVLTGGGLAATPPFVCAEALDEGVRVVIRGELEVQAHGADGSSLTLGAGRSATWNDDVVVDIAHLSVTGADGSRFEWLPAARRAAPVPPQTAPAAAAPSSASEPHTLDEAAFLELVAAGEAGAALSVAEEPEDHSEAADDEGPSVPSRAPRTTGLDFSGLLEGTSHGASDRPPLPPATGRPAPDPPPPPSPPPERSPLPPPSPSPSPAPRSTAPPPAPGDVPPPPGAPAITGVPGAPAPPGPALPLAPRPAPGAGTGLGEHDGRTMTLADLRRLQDEQGAGGAPAAGPPGGSPGAGPAARSERLGQVRAVRCPEGHPSQPGATTCRHCGRAIADPAVVTIPRPVVARLVFDSGLIVDVDRPQLIGRRPTSPPDAEEIPNLVTLPSPDSDLSRAHTAVRIEGWDVLVEDLRSTNGTEVRLPGHEPVRLREHDPVLVVPGTQVTMAGTVRFRVEAPEG